MILINHTYQQIDEIFLPWLFHYSLKTTNENVIVAEVILVNSTVFLIIGSINPANIDCKANEKFMFTSWLTVK
jgi:hypothetical protein